MLLQPLVDIVLPVYGPFPWLGEALDSVLAQTYQHWHLTVVDDGSPISPDELLAPYLGEHPERFSLLSLATNRGAAAARMTAIEQTGGDLISFIDQDDRWRPEKLARQVERCSSPSAPKAIHTNVEHIDAEGKLLSGSASRENASRAKVATAGQAGIPLTQALFLRNTIRLVSAVVQRRAFEAVGGFSRDLVGGEDWEFWVRFSGSHEIEHLKMPVVERRLHDGNTSNVAAEQRLSGALSAIDPVVAAQPLLAPMASTRRSILLRDAIETALLQGRVSWASKVARDLVRFAPRDWRSWVYRGLAALGPAGTRLLERRTRGSKL